MSTKRAKRTSAKQNRSSPAEQKGGAPANGRGSGSPTGRFWTQWIEPKGTALLSEHLNPCHLVVKNHGPHDVKLVSQGGYPMELRPGTVRATQVGGTIEVENTGENSVLIEFEFLPLIK
jgi:hypothetical protein